MEEEFRAILVANSAVVSLAPLPAINWGAHPQGLPLPGVVMNVMSDFQGITMAGADGLSQGRVQVDCYAMTYGAAKALSRAVVGALHAYRGAGFSLVEHVATRDSREGGSNEAERPFRVSLDFNTYWRSA